MENYKNKDRRCIFRETFNNAESVAKNDWRFTGSPLFDAGVLTFNGSGYGTRPFMFKSNEYTVRVIFKINDVTNGAEIVNFGYKSTNLHSCRIFVHVTTKLLGVWPQPAAFILYTTNFANDRNWHEIIVSAGSATINVYLDRVFNMSGVNVAAHTDLRWIALTTMGNLAAPYSAVSYKLLEVYNKALTENEVKNLYYNNTYHKPSLPTPIFNLTASKGYLEEKNNYLIPGASTTTIKYRNIYVQKFPAYSSDAYISTNFPFENKPYTICYWQKTLRPSLLNAVTNFSFKPMSGRGYFDSIHLSAPMIRPLLYLANSNFRYWTNVETKMLIPERWNFICLYVKGYNQTDINDAKLYENGKILTVVSTSSSEAAAPWTSLYIGTYVGTPNYTLHMNDFRVYSGELTPEMISQMYTSEKYLYQ